jgi:molybdopterin molybdotransferase
VITVAEALDILRGACSPGPEETVALREGAGRVLAREVRSDVAWPPFDTSAMDGYAVHLADFAPGKGPVAERPGFVGAGDVPPAPLVKGEAVRIMTGAPVPAGTEAILPVEKVRRENGAITALASPSAGEHVRRRGESIEAGAALLSRGRRLAASDIALAALAGADPLHVYRRPRVAIAVTGNELVPATAMPGPGQLRDSNGPMLEALCRAYGAGAIARPSVADEDGAVRRLFARGAADEDVLITSGGVSAGDLDLLPEEAARSGFEILFHGVKIRPGKPVAFGRRGAAFWFGLPGNPVSTSVCFHVFVRVALDALSGAEPAGPVFVSALLTRPIAIKGKRETYIDAKLSVADGQLGAEPIRSRGSHDLGAYARANALIRVPLGTETLDAGALVECLVLGDRL